MSFASTFLQCHKLIKDFTLLDMLYIMPHLHVSLCAMGLFSHSSDPKAYAFRYAHTYFDFHGANLTQLLACKSSMG